MQKDVSTGERLAISFSPFIDNAYKDEIVKNMAKSIDNAIKQSQIPLINVLRELTALGINSKMPLSVNALNAIVHHAGEAIKKAYQLTETNP